MDQNHATLAYRLESRLDHKPQVCSTCIHTAFSDVINIYDAFEHSQPSPLAFSLVIIISLSSSNSIFVFLFPSLYSSLSFHLSPLPPAGWMVCRSARCSSWCLRRMLTWSEHQKKIQINDIFHYSH